MIRSFACKHTEKLYYGVRVPRFQSIMQQAERRLQIFDSATCIEDLMNLPSNRFESLGGKLSDRQSIRINKQWRICFEWREDGPYNVEIVDYH